MKVFVVVLAIFVAAAWAIEVEEQDETEIVEVEDPAGYYRPKHCGTKQVCTTKQRCSQKFGLKKVCRKYCNTVKKCTKHHHHHSYDPYGNYYPPKRHCVPVTSCKHACHKQPTSSKVCKPVKSCWNVPKKCHHRGWGGHHKGYGGGYGSHYVPKRRCHKTRCIKDKDCKTKIVLKPRKVCSMKYYNCGYDPYGYQPKKCARKHCKTIHVKTPVAVCHGVKHRCYKVQTKCPKHYY